MTHRSSSSCKVPPNAPVGWQKGLVVVLTVQAIVLSYLFAVRASTSDAPRRELYAAAIGGVREAGLGPRNIRHAAARIWKALHAPATHASAYPDYLGFDASARTIAIRFDVGGSTKTVTMSLDRRGRVVGVAGVDLEDSIGTASGSTASTNVIGGAWVVALPDGEGLAVEFDRFWTGPIAAPGGDVCSVRLLDRDGELVVERHVAVDAPTVEAARDGVVGVEISGLNDGFARPEIRCTRWSGPGFVPEGAASATRDAPTGARPAGGSDDVAWIAQRLLWKGPHFPGMWRCTAKLLAPHTSDVVAQGTEHFLHPPAAAAENRTVVVPVRYDGRLSPVTPLVDCSPVNLEAGG